MARARDTKLLLRPDEVWQAVEAIDPLAVLAGELIGRTVWRESHEPGRLRPWTGQATETGEDLVVLERPAGNPVCVLPVACLRMAQAATLAALAARELLFPGAVTMAVLGLTDATQPQLALVARHVPDISHVAVCRGRLEPRLVDQLQLSGAGLTDFASVAETVLGANLVLVLDGDPARPDLAELRPGQLARRAVLINASGRDLPAALGEGVHELYVDTIAPGHGSTFTADLGELLTGRRAAHPPVDGIALVDLRGFREPSTEFAHRIHEAAARRDLGTPLRTEQE
jgi:hypothetical protein